MKRSVKIAALLLMILLISVTFFGCCAKKWKKGEIICWSLRISKPGKIYSQSKTDFYNRKYTATYEKGKKVSKSIALSEEKCAKFEEKGGKYGPDKWTGGGKKTVTVVYEYVYIYEYYGGGCKTVTYYDKKPPNYDDAGKDLKDLCGCEVLPECA